MPFYTDEDESGFRALHSNTSCNNTSLSTLVKEFYDTLRFLKSHQSPIHTHYFGLCVQVGDAGGLGIDEYLCDLLEVIGSYRRKRYWWSKDRRALWAAVNVVASFVDGFDFLLDVCDVHSHKGELFVKWFKDPTDEEMDAFRIQWDAQGEDGSTVYHLILDPSERTQENCDEVVNKIYGHTHTNRTVMCLDALDQIAWDVQ